jgi:hypothetical protein
MFANLKDGYQVKVLKIQKQPNKNKPFQISFYRNEGVISLSIGNSRGTVTQYIVVSKYVIH